jgi:ATP/ADP translocase
MQQKKKTKNEDGNHKPAQMDELEEKSLLGKTIHLFQRVPTLAALFGEVICFQSLSTVLNVYFVRQLKDGVPLDTDRASFTGRFYAYINGSAALMQFLVLPLARNFLEPKWVYRLMPLVQLPLLIYSALQPSSLSMAAASFFALKTMDYSLRNVVNEMVYQPLDFESRYLGKEVIGVFANRFGKSGMSMILSLLAPLGVGVAQLSQLAIGVASFWATSSVWLSNRLVTNVEAERLVQERRNESSKKKDE